MPCVAPQVWRSDTGKCVYEEAAPEGAGAGGQATLLQVAPGSETLMAATTDCRLRFYAAQACSSPAVVVDLPLGTSSLEPSPQDEAEAFAGHYDARP